MDYPSLDTAAKQNDVDAKVAKGAAGFTVMRFALRLIGFLNTIILARLLVKEDFGIVALGIVVMQLLQNISDIGVAQAVIKFRKSSVARTDTLFTLSLIRGVIVGGIVAAIAPFAGSFYQDPRVTQIFFAMAAISFMAALVNPRFYEFERDLDFSREIFVGLANKVISVIVSVSIAIIYQSFWAIVLGYMVGTAVQLVLSYVIKPYRPRFSLASFDELIGFSGWLTGLSALVALNNKTEPLILGKLLGAGPTGLYYVGEQIASMPTTEMATPITRALYPGMSTQQDDANAMRRTYLLGSGAIAAIVTPAAIGMAFVAEDLVTMILSSDWPEAAPVIQVFAPVLGLVAIYSPTQGLAMAKGLVKPVFLRELIFFLFKTPIFIAGAVFYGFPGALAAAAINSLLYVVLQARLYHRITGCKAIEPLTRAWRSLLSLGGMAAYFWGIRPFIGAMEDWPLLVRLLADVIAGASLYIGCHWALWLRAGRPEGVEAAVSDLLVNARKNLKGNS